MSNTATVIFTTDRASGDLNDIFIHSNPQQVLSQVQNYVSGIACGAQAASLNVTINSGNGVLATGDVTVTAPITGDSLVINGVAFVAGTDFALGSSDTITTSNLATAINASANALIDGIVTASASGTTLTITADSYGALGNLITLEGKGSHGIDPDDSGVAASGTLTCVSVAAADTAVVNGTTVTAVDKREKTQVTCVADTGAFETVIVTAPATAGATQGDYFVLTNTAGATAAFWLDIDANGTEPTGAAYVAANSKITVSIATGNTSAQNGTILRTAAATILGYAAVDNLDGTVTYTQTLVGNCTNAAKHNANDSGDGSFTFSGESNGAASNLNNKYFVFYSALDATKYAMWYNVNGEGVAPVVASATMVPIALSAGAAANTVASTSRTAFLSAPLSTDFIETGATDKILFQTVSIGATTNSVDTGTTGFTFSTTVAGGTVAATEFQIGATNTVSATNLKNALNAQAALTPIVVATSSLGVVTVTAIEEGIEGNNITLSATGGVTASAARLASGTDSGQVRLTGGVTSSSSTTYNYGR